MQQGEWTDRTGHEPTPEQWATITTVYGWHPSIPDVGGKDKLAAIFALGGFGLITDMLPEAESCQALESRRDMAARKLAEARADMENYAKLLAERYARYGRG